MANQIDERVKPFEVKMGKSIASLDSEFGTIRAGRANPHVLDLSLIHISQLKEGDLLEIFVDPNMIEIYANNGEYVLSQAVYGLGETFSYEMEKKPEIYLWNE